MRRVVPVVLFATSLSVGLVGCSVVAPAAGHSVTSAAPAHEATVRVVRGDVTPVLTVNGVVSSGTVFQLTAQVHGTFVVGVKGQLSVRGDNGVSYPIRFSAQYRHVTPLLLNAAKVVPGLPIVQATFTGFTLQADLTPVDLLKFTTTPVSARAQISGSGGPFDCSLLDNRPTPTSDASSPSAGSVACAIPASEKVISGLTGVLAIRFTSTENALVLPIAAVAGSRDQGEVYLKTVHGPVATPVVLGATDGFRIVVRSGLAEGDVVYIPSPGLLND